MEVFSGLKIYCALTAFSWAALESVAQAGPRFDLTCEIHGQKVVDYSKDLDQSSGGNGPARWNDTLRYAIDLDKSLYVGVDWIDSTPLKIVRSTKERIWLSEDEEGFERVNLRTNRYYARSTGATFMIEIVTGQCRRAKFSGFRRISANIQTQR